MDTNVQLSPFSSPLTILFNESYEQAGAYFSHFTRCQVTGCPAKRMFGGHGMDNFSDVINSPPYTHELRSKNIICFVFYPDFKWPGIPG